MRSTSGPPSEKAFNTWIEASLDALDPIALETVRLYRVFVFGDIGYCTPETTLPNDDPGVASITPFPALNTGVMVVEDPHSMTWEPTVREVATGAG